MRCRLVIMLLLMGGCALPLRPPPVKPLSRQSRESPLVTITPSSPNVALVNFITIAWDEPDPDVVAYNVYYSDTAPGVYDHVQNSTSTSCIISNFPTGATWHFAVTALDAAGNESDPSTAVDYTMPPMLDMTFQFPQAATNVSVQSSTDLIAWQPRDARARSNGVWRVDINAGLPMEFYRGIGQVAPAL